VKLLFIGPIPPPVSGFSLATQCILNHLTTSFPAKKSSIYFINRSNSRSLIRILLHFLHSIKAAVTLSPDSVYLALSGNLGILTDFLLLLPHLILKKQIYIHHHSFSYLNRTSIPLKFLMPFLSKCSVHHIILCDRMKELLICRYPCSSHHQFFLLSNIAIIPLPGKPSDTSETSVKSRTISVNYSSNNPSENPLNIGLLSNLTSTKGLFTFLEIAHSFIDSPHVFHLAGPIDDSEREQSLLLINNAPNVVYHGPLYHVQKSEFLSLLNVFLFPSTYANEAEPLVIHEAMSYGCFVIANCMGCIQQITSPYLLKSMNILDFNALSIKAITNISCMQLQHINELRDTILLDFQLRRHLSMNKVDKLCELLMDTSKTHQIN